MLKQIFIFFIIYPWWFYLNLNKIRLSFMSSQYLIYFKLIHVVINKVTIDGVVTQLKDAK